MGHEEDLKKIIQGYDFGDRQTAVKNLDDMISSIAERNKNEVVKGLQNKIYMTSDYDGDYWSTVGTFFYKTGHMGEALFSFDRALTLGNISEELIMYDYMISSKIILGLYDSAGKDCMTIIQKIFRSWGYRVTDTNSNILSIAETCLNPVSPTPKQKTVEYEYLKNFYKLFMETREHNVTDVDFSKNRDKKVENPEGELILIDALNLEKKIFA